MLVLLSMSKEAPYCLPLDTIILRLLTFCDSLSQTIQGPMCAYPCVCALSGRLDRTVKENINKSFSPRIPSSNFKIEDEFKPHHIPSRDSTIRKDRLTRHNQLVGANSSTLNETQPTDYDECRTRGDTYTQTHKGGQLSYASHLLSVHPPST